MLQKKTQLLSCTGIYLEVQTQDNRLRCCLHPREIDQARSISHPRTVSASARQASPPRPAAVATAPGRRGTPEERSNVPALTEKSHDSSRASRSSERGEATARSYNDCCLFVAESYPDQTPRVHSSGSSSNSSAGSSFATAARL